MLVFNKHVETINNTLKKRNNTLKSLAGSTWGKDKTTILTTYKAIGRSILNYAAPIWTPQVPETGWSRLQTTHNAALRIATGNHQMASKSHLHQECCILPVKDHNDLLSSQYHLATYKHDHPNNHVNKEELAPRSLRKNLSKYKPEVMAFLPNYDTSIDDKLYKHTLKELHTARVEATISNLEPNRVLKASPPPIAIDEASLPRDTQCTLSQLRSGWCKLLGSYQNKIDPSIPNKCDDCGATPHDVEHLFSCHRKTNHHNLNVNDLWIRPRMVAEYLGLGT